MDPKVILMIMLKPNRIQSIENSISLRSDLQNHACLHFVVFDEIQFSWKISKWITSFVYLLQISLMFYCMQKPCEILETWKHWQDVIYTWWTRYHNKVVFKRKWYSFPCFRIFQVPWMSNQQKIILCVIMMNLLWFLWKLK